jgi:hypothetical protein
LKEAENNPQFDQENILSARKFQKKKVLRESDSKKFYFDQENILSARKFPKKKVLRESYSKKFYFETD